MANPKIISYVDRGIKIENINEGVPINIFVKNGVPLAFKIEQDTAYLKYKIKVEFLKKDENLIKKEVLKNTEIFSLFNTMKKYMFSSDSIVYCFYKDGKVFIYDCMSNTNFFPYCDIVKIAYDKRYNYGSVKENEVGFIPMEPVLSGYKTSKEVLDFIDKYLKEHTELKTTDLFIMPAFPEFSSTTYTFLDETHKADLSAEEQDFDIEEIIKTLEEDGLEEINEGTKPENVIAPPSNYSKNSGTDVEYTLSFINRYIESKNILINEVEKTLITPIAELWTAWSNIDMMDIVYRELIKTYINASSAGTNLRRFPFNTLTNIFYNIWMNEEKAYIATLSPTQKSSFSKDLITKILSDEYVYYLQAFYVSFGKNFNSTWMFSDLPK